MIGSVGFPEFMLIFVVVLLVMGPKKLPGFARFLGRTLRMFKDTVNDTKRSLKEELDKADLSDDIRDLNRDIKDLRDIKLMDDEDR